MPNDLVTPPAALERRIPGETLKCMLGTAIGIVVMPGPEESHTHAAPADIHVLERLVAGIRKIGEPRR